jgi:hypothetical protein
LWDATPFGSLRTKVSQERISFIVRMDRICEIRITLAVNNNLSNCLLILSTLMMEAILSLETSVLATATLCHIPEDGILRIYRRENLNSYITKTWI